MKKLITVITLILLSVVTIKQIKAEDTLRVMQFEKGEKSGDFRNLSTREIEKFDTVSVKIDKSVPDSISQDQILDVLNSKGVKEIFLSVEKTKGKYSKYYLYFTPQNKVDKLYLTGDMVIKFKQGEVVVGTKMLSVHLIFAVLSIIFMIISNMFHTKKNFKFAFAVASAYAFAYAVAVAYAVAYAVALAAAFAAALAAINFTAEKNKKQYMIFSVIFYIFIIFSMVLSII